MKNLLLILIMFSFFSCKKIEQQPQRFTIFGEVTNVYTGLSIVSDNDEKINFESNTSAVTLINGDRVFVLGELVSQSGKNFEAKLLNLAEVDVEDIVYIEPDTELPEGKNVELESESIMITGDYLNIFLNTTSKDHNIKMYILKAEKDSNGTMVVEAELYNAGGGINNSQIISFDLSEFDSYDIIQLKLKYKYSDSVNKDKTILRTK